MEKRYTLKQLDMKIFSFKNIVDHVNAKKASAGDQLMNSRQFFFNTFNLLFLIASQMNFEFLERRIKS